MASYTANLAAILLSDNIVYDVQGMQDVLDRQLTICVVPQIKPEFVSLYPTAKTKALESSNAIVSVPWVCNAVVRSCLDPVRAHLCCD